MATRKFWRLVGCLVLAATAHAQKAPEVIPAGTRLRVKLETPVSTKDAHVGDGVEARLIEAIKLHEQIILPVGTYVSGRVAVARPADKKQHVHAALGLAFEKITSPDGRALRLQAQIQNLGVRQDVDREGVATQPVPSTGDKIGAVVTGGAAGAGIGAIAGGGKGAEIGAGIGGGLMALADWAASAAQWDDMELGSGRKMWLRLNQDLVLTPQRAEAQASPAAPQKPPAETPRVPQQPETRQSPEPAPSTLAAPTVPSLETAPAPSTSPPREAAAQTKPVLRVFLTDNKSWEAAGGIPRLSGTGPSAQRGGVRSSKPEAMRAFQQHCPAATLTVEPIKADYIILLDQRTWHSPPYKVTVLSREGDVLYSGGTRLLRNAVKDACDALTRRDPRAPR